MKNPHIVEGFLLMGCFVIMFNYMSYHSLEKPFEISYMWIGLISVAYLVGIYSSPRAASWGRVSWKVAGDWFGKEKEGITISITLFLIVAVLITLKLKRIQD